MKYSTPDKPGPEIAEVLTNAMLIPHQVIILPNLILNYFALISRDYAAIRTSVRNVIRCLNRRRRGAPESRKANMI